MSWTDFILTNVPPWLVILLFAGVWRVGIDRRTDLRPIALAAAIAIVDTAVLIYGRDVPLPFHTAWNWTGKLSSIVFGLVVVWALPRLDRRNTGLTFHQQRGSWPAAVTAILLLWVFALGLSIPAMPDLRLETLVFQATLPGIDEELMFRGILLALLMAGFGDRGRVFGARAGPSLLVVSFLFGAVHGFSHDADGFDFSTYVFLLTGLVGFGLTWIRLRTGSILLPIVAHNGFNFILQIFPLVWDPGPWQ